MLLQTESSQRRAAGHHRRQPNPRVSGEPWQFKKQMGLCCFYIGCVSRVAGGKQACNDGAAPV